VTEGEAGHQRLVPVSRTFVAAVACYVDQGPTPPMLSGVMRST
jgi:hypothetical protein